MFWNRAQTSSHSGRSESGREGSARKSMRNRRATRSEPGETVSVWGGEGGEGEVVSPQAKRVAKQ